MDPLQIMLIERACERLSHAWARALDFNDQDHFLDLFTPDGVLELDGVHRGTEALARYVAARPRGLRLRHTLGNHHFEVLAPDLVRGIAYVTRWEADSTGLGPDTPARLDRPVAMGHSQDRYRLDGEGWRLEARILRWAMRRPGSGSSGGR
jgi:hypothetical protein